MDFRMGRKSSGFRGGYLLLLLVLVSACISSQVQSPTVAPMSVVIVSSTISTTTTVSTSSSTSTTVLIPVGTMDENLTSVGEDLFNNKIVPLYTSFYQAVPKNDDERRNTTISIANRVCSYGPIKVDNLENLKDEDLRRIQYVEEIIKENYKLDLGPSFIEDMRSGIRKVSDFAPVVGSYNYLVNASCIINRSDDNSLNDFYTASFSFAVDIVLVQEAVGYKTAFKAVAIANNKLGLARFRPVCGDRCYGLVLSEGHWFLRGIVISSKDYLVQQGFDLNSTKAGVDGMINYTYDSANQAYNLTLPVVSGAINSTTGVIDSGSSQIQEWLNNQSWI